MTSHSHIYKAYVNKVSLGAKIPMFERVDFYAYIEYKLTVDRVQVENSRRASEASETLLVVV